MAFAYENARFCHLRLVEATDWPEYHSCMHWLTVFLVACSAALAWARVSAQGPVPGTLPPASDFHVTVQEDPRTAIRWGPPCGRDEEEIVRCHMFTISVENKSAATVRLDNNCREHMFAIWTKAPTASGEWLRVGGFGFPCHKGSRPKDGRPTGIRLSPGGNFSFVSGLMALGSGAQAPYTVRASVTLRGCIEPADHADCLSTLQAMPPTPGSAPGVHFQQPVTVVSNEIIVESPNVPDLGEMEFRFQVGMDTAAASDIGTRSGCTPQNAGRLDCITFRYTIRNLGARAVRNVVWNCNVGTDPEIAPEYRVANGEWKPFPSRFGCGLSTFSSTAGIPAGGTAEGKFTLATLHDGYSAKSLEAPGKYQLRFKFSPHACFASPDGSSCATVLQHPPPILSPEVTVDVR